MTKMNEVMNVLAMVTLLTAIVGGSAYAGVQAYPEIEAAKTAKTYVESVHREVERHDVEDVVNHDWTNACRFRRLTAEVKSMGSNAEDYTLTVKDGVTTVSTVKTIDYTMGGHDYIECHTYTVNDKDMTIVHYVTTCLV